MVPKNYEHGKQDSGEKLGGRFGFDDATVFREISYDNEQISAIFDIQQSRDGLDID